MLNKINNFITENYKISPKDFKSRYLIAYYTIVYFDFDNQPLTKLKQIVDGMIYNYIATKLYLENEDKIKSEFPEIIAIFMLNEMVNISYEDINNNIQTISFKSNLIKDSLEEFTKEYREQLNSIFKYN